MPPVLRVVVVALAAGMLLVTLLASGASAHGTTIDPPSRQYSCWARWGDNFQAPEMATEDPMCAQAWQADPNAMWNWNGLYRENVGGDHEAAVPDGQLCSAGNTGGTRYAALDEPGEWQAVELDNDFTVTVHDQALHGADYYRIFVTEQGFDPTTDELTWDDLELVAETDVIPPGDGETTDDPNLNGVSVEIDASAPGRTGRHIVYTIWQASHFDQTFYACSDVIFPGGDVTPAEDAPAGDPPAEEASEATAEPSEANPSESDVAPAEPEPVADEPVTDEEPAEAEEGGSPFAGLGTQLQALLELLLSFLGV
jgi:lytic cellulose monooxygenase (C4-dehydrogenating)